MYILCCTLYSFNYNIFVKLSVVEFLKPVRVVYQSKRVL